MAVAALRRAFAKIPKIQFLQSHPNSKVVVVEKSDWKSNLQLTLKVQLNLSDGFCILNSLCVRKMGAEDAMAIYG